MKLRNTLALALAAGALLLNGTLAMAGEKLKYAHVYETSEPYHYRMVEAAERIKQRTDGRYEIEVFPASALGKEADRITSYNVCYTKLLRGSADATSPAPKPDAYPSSPTRVTFACPRPCRESMSP